MRARTNRFPVMMTDAELHALDTFQHANQIATRAKALRIAMLAGIRALREEKRSEPKGMRARLEQIASTQPHNGEQGS